jgi:shikimate 5-dehydrogenase
MTDFDGLLATLAEHEVAFILVGGAAAIAHGLARLTQDLDIVYQRNAGNLDRLVDALAHHKPYLRGAPPGLPFLWSRATLTRGLNFILTTHSATST